MADVKLNSLYVTRDGLYIHHENDLVKVEDGKSTILKIPIHHLESIIVMGYSNVSPSLLNKCLKKGVSISFLTPTGRFLGRLEGAPPGNVLLRVAQIRKTNDESFKLGLAKSFVAGKIQNCRINLMRSGRDVDDKAVLDRITSVVHRLENNLALISKVESRDSLLGYEGDSAKAYFSVFDDCIVQQKEDFVFLRRSKRPPRSRVNALLSFVYSIATNDLISALSSNGLDPFVGFYHVERPGRPSLALDLIEEFRPFCDRLVLTLINRRQIQKQDFEEKIGGIYLLNDKGRKEVLTAYQTRKKTEITHYLLEQKCTIADLFQIQSRILARTIRGEMKEYVPYFWK